MRKRVSSVFGIRSLAIGQPVGVAEEHLAVLGDQHRAAEPVRSGVLVQQGLEALDRFALRESLDGELRRPRDRFAGCR